MQDGAIDLEIHVRKEAQKFSFTWDDISQGYVESPFFCHHIVLRKLDHLHIAYNISLVQYTVNIMITRWAERGKYPEYPRNIHELLKMGNKCYKDSRSWYISQVFSEPAVWGMLNYQDKEQVIAPCTSYHLGRSTALGGLCENCLNPLTVWLKTRLCRISVLKYK